MRNQPETVHEYKIPRLHWWFLISSALFVGCCVLMVWTDYSSGELKWLGLRADREWKKYQREFYDWERKRLAADAQAAELRAQEAGLDKIKADIEKADKDLAGKATEEAAAQAEVDKLKTAADLVTREFTMQKASRDEYRSFYEAALERHELKKDAPEVVAWHDKVESQNEFVDKLDRRKQEADAQLAVAQVKLTEIVGRRAQLEKDKKKLESSRELITKRLGQLSSPLVQGVVNAPVIEFAAGTYKVEQIIADDHHVDVNFTTVPRVDRCITCHKAIDRKDPTPEEIAWRQKHKVPVIEWSKMPEPMRSHPKLDLFVGENSPHPASKFGCTTCHWGWDRETSFSRAGHTPDAEEKHPYIQVDGIWKPLGEDDEPPKGVTPVEMTQKDAWIKNHHWEEQEFLTQPMRAKKFTQAACLKCHADQTSLTGGEELDHGRRLIEQLGCWSCHKMKQLETYVTIKLKPGEDFDSICKSYDVEPAEVLKLNQNVTFKTGAEIVLPMRTLRKVGPSLYKIAAKDTKDWTRKWLANPVAFRPNTYMPRFWGLDNSKDPDRDAVEINAVSEFLFAVSEKPDYAVPPVKGDTGRGKTLVDQLGCMGCHVVGEKLANMKVPAKLAKFTDNFQYRRYRSQGPELEGTGSKTTANWLYAWLKNPKQYHPGTKMPVLRLSDQEAADVAEYLAGLRNEATDKEALPAIDPHKLDEVTLEYLEITLPHDSAVEKLQKVELADAIEMYFADEETMPYFLDAGKLAREEAEQASCKKKFEEEFDDAMGKKADEMEARLKRVKAAMQSARDKAAGLSAEEKKNVYLGSKLISRYGCFACHNIRGFENAKPIGTELSEWGSKALNKIDFGLLEVEHSREAWLHQKLKAPRSFDTGRVGITRKPQELLKMPKFNLTPEQMDQIITVITGMTDEKMTAKEPKQLSPAEFQIERGRWKIKELNCQGCHLVDAHGWAIRATGIPAGMEPPMVSGTPTQLQQGQRTQPDWLFAFLKSPTTGLIRPWLKARMPTFGLSDAEANVLVRYFALDGHAQFPYQSPRVQPTAEELAIGKKMFDGLQCAKCHIVDGKAKGKPLAEIPEEELADLAPPLSLAHARLQRDWLVNKWLPDPLSQQPGTRMPQFDYGPTLPPKILAPDVLGGDAKKRIEALVDYVLTLDRPMNVETNQTSQK
jgi:cytochrome c2